MKKTLDTIRIPNPINDMDKCTNNNYQPIAKTINNKRKNLQLSIQDYLQEGHNNLNWLSEHTTAKQRYILTNLIGILCSINEGTPIDGIELIHDDRGAKLSLNREGIATLCGYSNPTNDNKQKALSSLLNFTNLLATKPIALPNKDGEGYTHRTLFLTETIESRKGYVTGVEFLAIHPALHDTSKGFTVIQIELTRQYLQSIRKKSDRHYAINEVLTGVISDLSNYKVQSVTVNYRHYDCFKLEGNWTKQSNINELQTWCNVLNAKGYIANLTDPGLHITKAQKKLPKT